MGKPRACDVCSLRKIRCSGTEPCSPCVKANFDCSFAKKPLKPGPKGPRATTSNRIRRRLHDIRSQASVNAHIDARPPSSSNTSGPSTPSSPHPDQIDAEWFVESPPRSLPAASGPSSITLHNLHAYLDIYHHKMYAVWPVVDRTKLLAKLEQDPNDAESWALAHSVCAATGAQLRLDEAFGTTSGAGNYSIIDRFAMEAERNRAMFDYKENATVNCILIPFFLHMYYSSKKKRFTATLLLREALTLCELLDLDKENMYAAVDVEEQKFRRKVFWLLFVTERGNAMQYDAAAVLRNTISLPDAEDDRDPVVFAAFLSLVHLFVAVEGTLVGSGANGGRTFSSELFSQLQQKLRDNPKIPPQSNEVQITDICVTQQWMRMLVWQLAVKNVNMRAGSSEDPLSLTYPAHVAKDSLALLSNVSLDSVIAHGPGMELKIFEIANSLLDVINCVPSVTAFGSALMIQGPREIFHGLSSLLASLSGSNSRCLNLLQAKMAASSVPFLSIPRLVEVHDDNVASPDSSEIIPPLSLGEVDIEPSSRGWARPASLSALHRRHESKESVSSSAVQPPSPDQLGSSFVSTLPLTKHDNFGMSTTIWNSLV